jgi:glyoxylase-like metal-dependent hydrolase (beta-lactamase superfamily II)
MQIKTVKVGHLETNCYIVADENSKEAIIIDPGDEADKILKELDDLSLRHIIITHEHPDHTMAKDALKKKTGAKIMMHFADKRFFIPDIGIKGGDEINIGEISFKVLHTPGHSKGCICLYAPGYLFSGDTLFADCHGRTDLPGGSEREMGLSLKRLSKLPGETKVYPGHGKATTIGREKESGILA